MRRAIRYQLTAICLSASLVLSGIETMAAGNQSCSDDLSTQIAQTAEGLRLTLDGKDDSILNKPELLPAGSSLSDWAALALALAGEQDDYDAYKKQLKEYVEQQYDKEGSLSDRKATEYHRIILTTLALGADPTSFGSYDLVKDGTYDYQGDDLGMQGINGWIFALIALDASGAEVPQDARYTRQQIQDAILKEQNEDGSFGLMPGTSDPDLTSMALQALAPDYNTDLKVQDAADQALGWLSGHMTEAGSFESYGAESAESCAQAVIALTALGIDPASDERFTKNGVNLLDGLERFKRDNGGYAHTVDDSESNFMATEQVLMAQVALQKYENGQGSLYDFTDYKGPSQSGNYAVPVMAATLTIAAGAGVWMIFRKRGKTHA